MHFLRSTTFAVLALASAVHGLAVPAPVALSSPAEPLSERGLTVTQVTVNIQAVTVASTNIQNVLNTLTTSLTIETIVKEGQAIVADFGQIIGSLEGFIPAMQGSGPFGVDDAQKIANVLTQFVKVHQAVLQTVIGKHGLFAYCGFTAPVAAILRALEAAIDAFAFALIGLIPTQTTTVQAGQTMLDESCTDAISTYSELCIPIVLGGICIGL